MVTYKASPHKEEIRKLVFKYFVKHKCTTVLTLPNLYFSLEERLVKKKIKVDCIERDLDIYKKQVKINPKNINLYKNNLGKFDVSSYDGLFLDLCGSFSNDLHKALKNITSGAAVVITLLKARESVFIQKYLDITNRAGSYVNLLKRYGLKTESYVEYNSGSPMIVLFCVKMG